MWLIEHMDLMFDEPAGRVVFSLQSTEVDEACKPMYLCLSDVSPPDEFTADLGAAGQWPSEQAAMAYLHARPHLVGHCCAVYDDESADVDAGAEVSHGQ